MKQNWSIQELSDLLKTVPNFPKPGIQFKDITPILENSSAFRSLAQHLRELVPMGATKLLAIESRGFLLAAAIAQYLDAGVVLVRKPGKLPRETLSIRYDLEYGQDELQMHKDSLRANDRIVVIDDVLATGGTAKAAENLALKSGAKVLGACFLLEITGLRGGKNLAFPYKSLIKV